MIKVYIPSSQEFKKYEKECKNLYENLRDKISDPNSFEFIRDETFFFLFTNDETLIGAIYYFIMPDGRLFFNAFSKRKMYEIAQKCLKMTFDWFHKPIYAEAQNRASAICLLRQGFKKLDKNIFCLENN